MISLSSQDRDSSEKKELFEQSQKTIQKKFKTKSKPLNLVVDGDYYTKKIYER